MKLKRSLSEHNIDLNSTYLKARTYEYFEGLMGSYYKNYKQNDVTKCEYNEQDSVQ